VAKPELGTKRICPETGRKFYDLNKDPIVSPYTGKSYPLGYFETVEPDEEEEIEEKAVDTEASGEELVTVDEDGEASAKDDDLPDLGDDDVDLGDDDSEDDTFLEDDDEDEDDVSGIISVGGEDDDES
jgi:uncharacterized protein (TIGR02300 family)